MPSTKHELVVDMFEHRPALAVELLRDCFGVPVVDSDTVATARVAGATLTEPGPPEYHADLVVTIGQPPVAMVVIEPQLSPDPGKRLSWPGYLAVLFGKRRCRVYLLVVTFDQGVARRCAEPIELGHPGFVLRPLVLGPEAIEVVTEPAAACARPEVAVLSAMAHGRGSQGEAVARAALSGALSLESVDRKRATIYQDMILASVNAALRCALEEQMITNYEYQSETFKRLVAEGETKGETKAQAKAILAVLRTRGLRVAAETKQRIVTCTDLGLLDQWLVRAVTVDSAADLFE